MKSLSQCAILVGGLGSRLGEITSQTPKPLLDCGGRPFVSWIIKELIRYGITDFILLTGYRSEAFEESIETVKAHLPRHISIRLCREPAPAGTGGALWYARDLLDESFLIVNGDSWIDASLAGFVKNLGSSEAARMALRRENNSFRFGVVDVDGSGRVTSIKRREGDGPASLVNAGIYLFAKDMLQFFKAKCSIEDEVFPTLISKRLLSGEVVEGRFIDIGVPSDYERARSELPRWLTRPAIFFDRDGVLNEDLGWVGSIDRFCWTSTAKEAVRAVNDAGYYAFVVSNQAGVGKGFYSEADVDKLQRWINSELRKSGANIDEFSYCPHHPDAAVERYRRDCYRRKPQPGMIDDLCSRWNVEREKSLLIGDRLSDIKAAESANIKGALFNGGDLKAFVDELLPRDGSLRCASRN